MVSAIRLLFLCVALLFLSCDSTNPIDNDENLVCIDNDNDSYGVYCEAGLDCDDDDPEIFADCFPDDPCRVPRFDCPCDTEGEAITCRTSTPIVSEDGAELCYSGTRYCVDGLWTICDNMSSYLPFGDDGDLGADTGTERYPLLDGPDPCPSSCNESCMNFYDCPSGADFTATNSVDLDYDVQVAPAAVVLAAGATDGFFYHSFESVCGAEQMAVWWAVDWVFFFDDPEPDQRIQIDVRAAPTEADLAAEIWTPIAICPDTDCTALVNPWDQTAGSGNVYDAIDSTLPWLETRIWLHRADAALFESPRYRHTWTYYFCIDAT